MRPSVQLSSVSNIDIRLSLTLVRPNLQSAPELPALDPPLVISKHVRQIRNNFFRFLKSGDFDPRHFQLKIGTPLTRARGNVYANFYIFLLLRFRVTSTYETGGQTELTD